MEINILYRHDWCNVFNLPAGAAEKLPSWVKRRCDFSAKDVIHIPDNLLGIIFAPVRPLRENNDNAFYGLHITLNINGKETRCQVTNVLIENLNTSPVVTMYLEQSEKYSPGIAIPSISEEDYEGVTKSDFEKEGWEIILT